MSSNKGWKYGMIVVEIDDDGDGVLDDGADDDDIAFVHSERCCDLR